MFKKAFSISATNAILWSRNRRRMSNNKGNNDGPADQHKDNHSMTVHLILHMRRIALLVSWWTFQVEQLLYVAGNVPFQGISVLTLRLSLSLWSSVVH
jgi:hypothetical protein